jgi:hypothetical protein
MASVAAAANPSIAIFERMEASNAGDPSSVPETCHRAPSAFG